jgi:two-component system sensor histidine kinase KdpD
VRYGGAAATVVAATGISAILQHHAEASDLTMLYLLGVVISAIAFGLGPAIIAALLSVATFDFLFVAPRFTFRVSEASYLVTFAVMFVVAVITGTLTARLREQRERAVLRERRIASLHRLSRDLALRGTSADILGAVVGRLGDLPGVRAAGLVLDGRGATAVAAGDPGLCESESERRAVEWMLGHGMPAELVDSGPEGARGLQIPLVAGTRVNAVLVVRASDPEGILDRDRMEMIRAFSNLAALALERCRLAEDTRQAQTRAEAERARSALLSSVSHDLRTPLAAITGAASTLADRNLQVDEGVRKALAETISQEAARLNRLIGNLLEMTRLESGTIRVRKEWQSMEEIVGASLDRLASELGGREIRISRLRDLPLIPMDGVLFEQVVCNLVENAHKYSGAGEPIDIQATVTGDTLRLEVADRGKGLAPGEEERVFEKFYRGTGVAGQPGAGLGLAICRGIMEAHGGTIKARRRPGGGSLFVVTLPVQGAAPAIEGDDAPDQPVPGET